MVEIKKCQSKKHRIGGCGDPRCPEGLSIKAALDEAVKNHDLNSFLSAREMVGAAPSWLESKQGMLTLTLAAEKKRAWFKYPANRPDVIAHIQSIDKSQVLSFENPERMEEYLNTLYRPYASVSFDAESDKNSGYDLNRLHVADMRVDADVRGAGIGRHMRATILKFADEHNYVVTGTPTESGDGSLTRTEANKEEFKAHAMAHKARLEKFYLDSGYEYNYAYVSSRSRDYWTDEPFPRNEEWVSKLNPAAARFLQDSGFYVRWPNNEIPKNWKAGARKPRKTPAMN